jgi:hypothetical protein
MREDITPIELMAAGGGRGCGKGLRGFIGGAMHSMQPWMFRAGIACIFPAMLLSWLRQGLQHRLQRRINRADKSLCPLCAYPLSGPRARCPECGADAAAPTQRCRCRARGRLGGAPEPRRGDHQ